MSGTARARRVSGWALLLAACMLAAPLARAQDSHAPAYDLVSLSAQSEREVPNDTLVAVLAAEVEGADPAQLADRVNHTVRRALASARGVHGVSLRNSGYQTYPVYDNGRLVRWRLRETLRLEATDFSAASALIGKLQASLTLASLQLEISPAARREAENALITSALAAFGQRADVIRAALKAKGYRIRELRISGGAPLIRPLYAAALAQRAAVSPPAIAPGASRVSVQVSGTIQLLR